jgi:hypothetical protein
MQVGEEKEMTMKEFFLLAMKGGTYEVDTPDGWQQLGRLKLEHKDCYLIRTAGGRELEGGHDHLVETEKGWEKIEEIDVSNTQVATRTGLDPVVAREHLGSKTTYDFEVVSENHRYYSNDISSHNCGKTLTCKWLRQLCVRHKLAYKIVTLETYRRARERGTLKNLFKLPEGKRGIVFFDDMDQAVKSRESGNVEVCNFLTALDGIDSTEGVVFIFTTNYVEELDQAFVRPGRIDVFMPFRKPSRQLRQTFIEKTFSPDLLDKISTDDVLDKSNEYTFAELEEIRKLLCLAMIDGEEISVDKTFELYNKHRQDFKDRADFGFNQKLSEDSNGDEGEYVYDEENPDFQ